MNEENIKIIDSTTEKLNNNELLIFTEETRQIINYLVLLKCYIRTDIRLLNEEKEKYKPSDLKYFEILEEIEAFENNLNKVTELIIKLISI